MLLSLSANSKMFIIIGLSAKLSHNGVFTGLFFFVIENYTFAAVLGANFFGTAILEEVFFGVVFFSVSILGVTVTFLIGAAFFWMFFAIIKPINNDYKENIYK